MEKQINSLQTDVSRLSTDVANLKQQVGLMKTSTSILTLEISNVKKRMEPTEKSVAELLSGVSNLQHVCKIPCYSGRHSIKLIRRNRTDRFSEILFNDATTKMERERKLKNNHNNVLHYL